MTGARRDRHGAGCRATADPDTRVRRVHRLGGAARGSSSTRTRTRRSSSCSAGNNVVLATPTGSGKSLVAMAAHAAALADDRVSFYTAPIKALVSEKFFALCEVFGAENVGMLTGDASVNADAPIICCTAEVLANIALREGAGADVGLVVMDEFHFYAEPDRGWAWQVPLLELPRAQFLLMSATLGDVTRARRRPDPAQRPRDRDRRRRRAPGAADLHLGDDAARRDARGAGRDPARRRSYVVHFTQAAAVEHATSLLSPSSAGIDGSTGRSATRSPSGSAASGSAPASARRLRKLLRSGIGVHHAGMLPRYRRLVEQLAQAGLLHGHLRHRHPRRRHQRADPHGAVHRAGEVRRQPAAGPALARVPADRRPRRPGRLRHRRATSSSRRPSTSSRTRRPRRRPTPRTPR